MAAAAQPEVSGQAVYVRYCAACHERVDARIPPRDALTKMSPARILRALDFGQMMSIAYPMRRDEREAVAGFLGKGVDEAALPASAFCKADGRATVAATTHGWSGWAASQDNTRFQTAQSAGLTVADIGRLQVKWAFGFSGDVTAFAAPTVHNGWLFVGSAGGMVQALDASTGCVHWQYQANGPVRAAMTVAAITDSGEKRDALVFSDQNGGVYALDARSRQGNLEDESGGARGHAIDRVVRREGWHCLRSCCVMGGNALGRSACIPAARFAAA